MTGLRHLVIARERVQAAYLTGQVLMPNSVVNHLSPRDAIELEKQMEGQSTFPLDAGPAPTPQHGA